MKKQCRRKVWQLLNPLAHVLEGIQVTPNDKLDQLMMRELSALEAMAKGRATLQEWQDLTAVLNVCESMAMSGIGPEALPHCQTLQSELKAAARRYEKTKRMGMTATGLQAAREVIEYHDLQRRSITRGEYEAQIQRTLRRIRSSAREVEEV